MTPDHRPSMDETLLHVAYTMALRGTCPYRHVGAVFAREGRVLSSGFNGAAAGLPHCAHPATDDLTAVPPCRTAVHAEANAVAFAAKEGVALRGATLYTTLAPCLACAQLVVNTGAVRVVMAEPYRDDAGHALLREAGLTVELLPNYVEYREADWGGSAPDAVVGDHALSDPDGDLVPTWGTLLRHPWRYLGARRYP